MIEGIIGTRKLRKAGFCAEYPSTISQHVQLTAGKNTFVGRNCSIQGSLYTDEYVHIDHNAKLKGNITIGTGTYINEECDFRGTIVIGRYCAIARNVVIQEVNHETRQPAMQVALYREILGSDLPRISKGIVEIKNDVWVATRAIILSGVTVGNGAIIAAGAVVTKDVEPYTLVAGVPATFKKYRFPKSIIAQLERIQWWNWDRNKIARNHSFFNSRMDDKTELESLIV